MPPPPKQIKQGQSLSLLYPHQITIIMLFAYLQRYVQAFMHTYLHENTQTFRRHLRQQHQQSLDCRYSATMKKKTPSPFYLNQKVLRKYHVAPSPLYREGPCLRRLKAACHPRLSSSSHVLSKSVAESDLQWILCSNGLYAISQMRMIP